MRGECPGLKGFWGRCLVIDMRIKCHSCNLTFLLPLTPPEMGRQLGYCISNSICVNFNAFTQKERGKMHFLPTHFLCISKCTVWSQWIFLVLWDLSYKGSPAPSRFLVTFPARPYLSSSPSRDLHFRNQLWLTMFQKLSPFSQGPVISVQIWTKLSFICKRR